jgi:hypothetical protein
MVSEIKDDFWPLRSLPQMAPMDADEFISKSANVCVICGLVHHRWPLCAFEWGIPACLGSSASGATAEALDTFDVPKSLEEEAVSRVKVVDKKRRIRLPSPFEFAPPCTTVNLPQESGRPGR